MNKTLITFLTVLFCLTSSVGYSQYIVCEYTGFNCPEIDLKELIKKDDLFYKKFTDVPFSGTVVGKDQGSLRGGKREGLWVGYYDNGLLRYKSIWQNGKREGYSVWYDSVFEGLTGTYKNGIRVSD